MSGYVRVPTIPPHHEARDNTKESDLEDDSSNEDERNAADDCVSFADGEDNQDSPLLGTGSDVYDRRVFYFCP